MLVSRGLARVISDLAKMGYDAQWTRFSASNFGAPHQRDRLWIVANTQSFGLEQTGKCKCSPKKWSTGCGNELSDTNCIRCNQVEQSVSRRTTSQGATSSTQYSSFTSGWEWWAVEPGLGRVAAGVANRVDRLKATGNGQVSIVAVNAYQALGMTS